MLKTKKTKIFIVLLLVISLLFPYATPVALAVDDVKATAKEDTMVIRRAKKYRYKNGDKAYEYYHASTHDVFNIGFVDCDDCDDDDDVCENDELYCVDARTTMTSNQTQTYKNVGNFFDPNTEGISEDKSGSKEKSFIDRLVTEDEEKKFETESKDESFADEERQRRYEEIIWLAQNIYIASEENEDDIKLKNGGTKYEKFLEEVFKDYLNLDGISLDNIKENLDKDDIKAISQIAIWYFSNKDAETQGEESTEVDPYIHIKKNDGVEEGALFKSSDDGTVSSAYEIYKEDSDDCDIECVEGDQIKNRDSDSICTLFKDPKEILSNILLSYYIINAEKAVKNGEVKKENMKFPELEEDSQAVATIDGDNYKIGPFKITDSNVNKDVYSITLKDGNQKDLDVSKYSLKEIVKENNEEKDISSLTETIGKTFYIYIPVSYVKESNISSIRLGIEYLESLTNADFWIPSDEAGASYQPVIEIERTPVTPVVKEVTLNKGDLALRKYITAINDEALDVSRVPVVDASGLANGDEDAKYKHKKSPVEVSVGDIITYELTVYNEGEIDATVKEIKDIIPQGLELVDTDNDETDGWTLGDDGVARKKLNVTLTKRDNDKVKKSENINTENGGLSTTSVTIKLLVKDTAQASSILTNVAEISGQNIPDTSTPDNFKPQDVSSSYSGKTSNKDDLDDSNYFYQGIEDDDDFEKVKIKGEVFDLSLKKFITEKNGEKVEGREPSVDVSPLKNGASDANYTTSKNPVLVEKGDVITYTIRVYNEGDKDGFAEEVADYIPEGLGFLTFHKTNTDNSWSITDAINSGAQTVKLNTINNAINNLNLSDFENVTSLDDVEVLVGKAKIVSTALASGTPVNKSNLIEKFDPKNDNDLHYKDIKVTCVVIDDVLANNNFRNVAEINKHSSTPDGGNTINPDETDRDSQPGNVETFPGQDDDDDENLTVEEKVYDLALQKFITQVDATPVTGREPTVTRENDEFKYAHSTDPYPVANGQLVEYTIRVYNEGKTDAYASEIADNIPNGLQFVPENEINQQYGWYLVDKNGNRTQDINQAFTVRTDYLSIERSKERNEDNLLKGYDGETLDSRDVKIVFQVAEDKIDPTVSTEKRVIINVAEITKETDKDGTPVDDEDSVPDNWTDGEDDIDKERVYVKYFDLALKKNLVKVIVSEGGNTTEYNVSEDQLFKVEINKKKLNSTTVKFVYDIVVTNQGEIEGYATEVKDYIPEGLEFVADDNPEWYSLGDNVIGTGALANTLLQPNGGSASVRVTLRWINSDGNLGRKVNVAEISKHKNPYDSPDIDSTPDNQVPGEDDIDDAPVLLSISTGSSKTYYGLIASVTVIMVTGVALIKKYVL